MKLSVVLLVVIISAFASVDGLWSSKCREAETSDDKIVKLIQNANCTLQGKTAKLNEGFKNFREGFRGKMQAFQTIFSPNKTTPGAGDELDYAIDVRMFRDDAENLIENEEDEETTNTPRSKRDDDEGEGE
jgi:FtsZ-interacting cell division protein ZipA